MGSVANYGGTLGTFLLPNAQFIYRDSDPAKLSPTSLAVGTDGIAARTEMVFGTTCPPFGGTGTTQYFETYQYLPAGQYYVSMIVNLASDRTNGLALKVDGVTIGTISLNNISEYAYPWRVTAGTTWSNTTSSIKNIRLTTSDATAGNRYIAFSNVLFHRQV